MSYIKLFFTSVVLFITAGAEALTFNHPLTVDKAYVRTYGSIISGNYEGTLTEPAITIATSTPILIENAYLTGPGDLIYARNANLTVRNTTGVSTNPNVVGSSKGIFLNTTNFINIHVEHCTILGSSTGIYLGNYSGNHTSSQTIKILHNVIINTDGRESDGNDGYLKPTGPINAYSVQLIFSNNLPGAEIAWNEISNDYDNSSGLASLQLFDSGGISNSHFLIHDNFFRGNSNTLITFSSLGSDTAASVPAFVDIYNNQIISAATYGVQINTGHDLSVYNNRVISSGYSPAGNFIANPNAIGLINANSNNLPSTVFFNNHMHDNFVGFLSSSGRSDWSLAGQGNQVENNKAWLPYDNTDPSLADEDKEYQLWKQKLGSNNFKLGAH